MLRLGHHQERRKEIKLTFVNENDIILFQLKGIAFILFLFFIGKIDSRFYLFIITLYNWKEKKKKCLVVKKMENHWFVWFAFFKKCF